MFGQLPKKHWFTASRVPAHGVLDCENSQSNTQTRPRRRRALLGTCPRVDQSFIGPARHGAGSAARHYSR